MTVEKANRKDLLQKYKPLVNLIQNEPLIEAKPSMDMLFLDAIDRNPTGSIYYGTGLTTPREIGVGQSFREEGLGIRARIRGSHVANAPTAIP